MMGQYRFAESFFSTRLGEYQIVGVVGDLLMDLGIRRHRHQTSSAAVEPWAQRAGGWRERQAAAVGDDIVAAVADGVAWGKSDAIADPAAQT